MLDSEDKAASLVRDQAERLKVSMMRSMEVLYSIASLHAAEGEIQRGQFHQFVQQAIQRQPELQALSWNPRVPDQCRAGMEASAAAAGFAGFSFRERDPHGALIVAFSRPEYVPVYFIEPMEGNVSALGYDLASDECRRRGLQQARDTAQPVATAPLQLAQEAMDQAGILVLLPVYHGRPPSTLAGRREHLAGFAVAVFRASTLVGDAFSELRARGIEARLLDGSTDGELIYAGPQPGSWQPARAGLSLTPIEVAGRRWVIAWSVSPSFFSQQTRPRSWLVLAGGLMFTFLGTAFLYADWRRDQEIAAANAALADEVRVRQKAESEAESANRAKSDFLASMSHEIRTPLNAILGYTQLMRRDPDLSPEQKDAARGISSSGEHLLGLINEILDLSKIEAGRMEVNPVDFDLASLARDLTSTFQPLCAQKRIEFRCEFADPPATRVRGDAGKLRQILINLVGNAVKFTDAGEVFLRFQPSGEGIWLFEVIDTGLGIPSEEQFEIFKPFHQGAGARHHGGTGLGLSIAQRQVELLGGLLRLQSERGIGTRFYFELPLAPASSPVEETTPSPVILRLKAGHTVRVLIVDDHPDNRKVLGGMLSSVGCEVWFAADGREAERICREQRPELVFLDLIMPEQDGASTALSLLANPACGRPKIVAHSASPLSRHREDALSAGCVEFLSKPFRCEQLYSCLQRHLGVEFDHAEPTSEPEAPPPADKIHIRLPDELYARLALAAELHSTTALKKCLQEVCLLGPDGRHLAAHIRLMMRGYNMDGILRLLNRAAPPGNVAQSPETAHAAAAT